MQAVIFTHENACQTNVCFRFHAAMPHRHSNTRQQIAKLAITHRGNVRQLLFLRNSFWIMLFKSFLVSRQFNYLTNPNFVLSFSGIYGSNFLEKVDNVFKQMDSDMMIFIIIFSSNSCIVTFNPSDHIGLMAVVSDVVRIQDIYVTVLWKYLIHQYGFREAVLRYSSLIKTLMNGYWMLETMSNSEIYEQILHRTAKQMKSSLAIEE